MIVQLSHWLLSRISKLNKCFVCGSGHRGESRAFSGVQRVWGRAVGSLLPRLHGDCAGHCAHTPGSNPCTAAPGTELCARLE